MKTLHEMIVSHTGAWQRVVQKNLEAYDYARVIDVVSGTLSASQLAKEQIPNLTVIDSSIPFDDVAALVKNVKHANSNVRSLDIIDTTQQRRKITQAEADYTISAFKYENQIGEILNQLKKTITNS